jgi:hypothetical protein
MSNDAIETIELEGDLTLNIYQDTDPGNPRKEWDNLGTMVCFHSGYKLGDDNHGFSDPTELMEYLKVTPHVALKIYAYEHGGITITASPMAAMRYPFTDPWDSGILGIIFITHEKIRKEYGWKYITATRAKQIRGYLENEVETYDQYLTGQVYGFDLTCNQCGESLESVWGFYGYDWKTNGIKEYVDGVTCSNCQETVSRLDAIGESND